MDDVALGDEVGIELLHHEVEVVGIGNRGGSSGNGSGIGARGSSWDCGSQLETTVDFLGLATHRVDQRTNLNSGSLAIQLCRGPKPEEALLPLRPISWLIKLETVWFVKLGHSEAYH